MAKAAMVTELGGGFFTFIKKYNAIPLAIGVVLGVAVNDVVTSLVNGIIMPLISLVNPDNALQSLVYSVGEAEFMVGDVVNSIISFLAVAFTVYILAKVILKDDAMLEAK